MSIAGYAGANHILPVMLAIAVSRDDMVQGKLAGLLAAILAGVAVAIENLKASQLSLAAGTFNQVL